MLPRSAPCPGAQPRRCPPGRSQDHSQLLLAAASAAAAKRPDIKFVKIVAQNCVEGYPERNTPTVFVYSDGAVAKQVVTLRELAGTAVNADGV